VRRQELAGLGAPPLYLERRTTDYARPGPAWFTDARSAGGGIAMLVGVHSIDRACWPLGAPLRAVAGSIAVPAGWGSRPPRRRRCTSRTGRALIPRWSTRPEFVHDARSPSTRPG
jgi:predicted dehydrogenase